MNIPRIVLAGTQSGVGKTTISTGIMAALRKRNLIVQPFKVGPDYIDPAFHSFVTGRKSRNLDSWMLEANTLREIFIKNNKASDIAIVEGVMGLYDGLGSSTEGSTAQISKLLKAPVVLIINGKGMASSAAAQVLGYKSFDPEVDIRGVIINNVSSERHYEILKNSIEKNLNIKCLGYLYFNNNIKLESRHLGLIPTLELDNLKDTIDIVADMVEKTIDVDEIVRLSKYSPPLDYIPASNKPILEKVNIGVAIDKAFHFYYEDNLDLLREMGANLKYFSPMIDSALPDNIHGLYFGGGYPEIFAKELEDNQLMKTAVKTAIEGGLPTYAECGGLMYLTESITAFDGTNYKMVGIYNVKSTMTGKLQRFGYVNVNIDEPCVIANEPSLVRAHEFHRSMIEEDSREHLVYSVTKANDDRKTWKCGLSKYKSLGAYAHIHFYSNKKLAENFINSCISYKIGSEKNEK